MGWSRDGAVAFPWWPVCREPLCPQAGKRPKNDFGASLFPVTVAAGLQYAEQVLDADVVDVLPRYNPRWTYWLLRVPGIRELVTWNLVIVLRRR